MKSKSSTTNTSVSISWKPRSFHKKACEFTVQRTAAALFLPPSAGKTSITLKCITTLKRVGKFKAALVVAPLRPCYLTWPAEIEKWTEFNDLKCVILHGKDKEDNAYEAADIYLINPEGLKWLFSSKVWTKLSKRVDTLIIDELTKFKNLRSQRGKLLKKELKIFTRRWGLTGSPAAKGLLDLFGQVFMLDMGVTFGPYITHWRKKYFEPAGFMGYSWELKEGAEAQIFKALKPIALRIDEKELDLPQRHDSIIEVTLPPDARRAYNIMEAEFIVALRKGAVVAANAAVASGKCLQIANGGVYYTQDGERGRSIEQLHDAKTEALGELMDELNGLPVLVAYNYEHDVARLKKMFGKRITFMGAGVNMTDTKKIEARWNSGKIEVLAAHPASIGHGLNLQGAGFHVCWYGMTWNFELYDQFIRRVLRVGNKSRRVYVHHIVAKDTLDEVQMMVLRNRERNQNRLFDALKLYARTKKV